MGRLVAGLVAAAVLSGAPPLLADKPEKSKGKSKGQGTDAAIVVTFTTDQRQGAQAYFVEKHGRGVVVVLSVEEYQRLSSASTTEGRAKAA